jgi:hypothetical protein
MQVNKQRLLSSCIDDGLELAVYAIDDMPYPKMQEFIFKAREHIWLQIDTYFNFDDNN